jgi:hypothetical protein
VLESPEAARTLLELNHGLRTRYGSAENPAIGTFAGDVKLLDGRGRYLGPDTEVVAAWADRVDAEQTPGEGRLVRPDGYVAWAGADPDELRPALTRWFGVTLSGTRGGVSERRLI